MNRRGFLKRMLGGAAALYVPTKVYSIIGSGLWTPPVKHVISDFSIPELLAPQQNPLGVLIDIYESNPQIDLEECARVYRESIIPSGMLQPGGTWEWRV